MAYDTSNRASHLLHRNTRGYLEQRIGTPGVGAGITHGTFGIEKRAGGHTFQLNFSNSFGTTMGQIARGGFTNDD